MSGAIPPLPNTPSWRGAQLKHRENFTFCLFNKCCLINRVKRLKQTLKAVSRKCCLFHNNSHMFRHTPAANYRVITVYTVERIQEASVVGSLSAIDTRK
jgi:hypothetical protein